MVECAIKCVQKNHITTSNKLNLMSTAVKTYNFCCTVSKQRNLT